MAVIRTRFLFWLLKAYIKKWGKLFAFFFLFGLLFFILLLRFYPLILRNIPFEEKKIIGISGAYTLNELPEFISYKVTSGLTKLEDNGKVSPDLATSWDIKDNGRTYIFHLKQDVKFSDGTQFTSEDVQYSFKDVAIARPDDFTVEFKLKDEYAPFLVTVSKPIYTNGYVGVGEYRISKVELNGEFMKSIQLSSIRNRLLTEIYIFYPTNDSLKTALIMGEINEAYGIMETKIHNSDLVFFNNLTIDKNPNYSKLVTLFFDNNDPIMSDKKWRSGLSYAIPDKFPNGLRVYNPYPPNTYFFNSTLTKKQDLTHAKLLIASAMESASASAVPDITLKAHKKYIKIAGIIKDNFEKAGVNIKIEEVETVPDAFQIYLGDFNVPKDPDQYTLWHSGQENNITKFKNLRIDKLLEDGRRTTNTTERITIYSDFQKYISDESPAIFLYFPIEFTVRKD